MVRVNRRKGFAKCCEPEKKLNTSYGVFGPGQGPGRMGCMVLIRTFHTAPEQGQGRTPGTFSGPEEWVWYPFFRS